MRIRTRGVKQIQTVVMLSYVYCQIIFTHVSNCTKSASCYVYFCKSISKTDTTAMKIIDPHYIFQSHANNQILNITNTTRRIVLN